MKNIEEAKAYVNELCEMYHVKFTIPDDVLGLVLSDDFMDSFIENLSCGRSVDASIQWDM